MPDNALRLELDGLEPFVFGSSSDADIVVSQWELTFPDIRSVTEDRPGADGQTDSTQFFGARAATITASIAPSTPARTRQSIMDRFRAFCLPGRRPYLYFAEEPGGPERRIQLRADQQSSPLSSPSTRDLAASWRCPNPYTESAEATVATLMPMDPAGVGFPITFPFTFAGSGGSYIIGNEGNVPAGWVARIFGPCVGPALLNGGQTISLPDLTVDATEYVEIDPIDHTVLVNGDPGASRYGLLDTSDLTWWLLAPGANEVRYVPGSSSGASQVEFTYRSSWI